jgi:hypothetical protein
MRVALLPLIVLLPAATAVAQPLPELPGDRYAYSTVGEGVLRLDLRTGAVSLCAKSLSGWTCRAVPDERAALETEILRLQNDNAALKKALVDRGLPLPNGQETGTPLQPNPSDPDAGPKTPEMRRLLASMEKAWQRLVDLMASLKSDRPR